MIIGYFCIHCGNPVAENVPCIVCALKSENASLERRLRESEGEAAKLREQVAQMQWTPITPENLPKIGDEVLSPATETHLAQVMTVPFDGREHEDIKWQWAGWTHFRPIAPPEAL